MHRPIRYETNFKFNTKINYIIYHFILYEWKIHNFFYWRIQRREDTYKCWTLTTDGISLRHFARNRLILSKHDFVLKKQVCGVWSRDGCDVVLRMIQNQNTPIVQSCQPLKKKNTENNTEILLSALYYYLICPYNVKISTTAENVGGYVVMGRDVEY